MSFDPVTIDALKIQVELSGVGGGWTDLEDVLRVDNVEITRGISGTTIRDRVASTGSMTFSLDNSELNSHNKIGLYSKNHANALAGWDIGIGVRCLIRYVSVDEPVFVGTISDIIPVSGKHRSRKVVVSCVDWMEEAAQARVGGLPLQLNKRSDEVFALLVSGVERQPTSVLYHPGGDTYAYALDNAVQGETSIMSEMQSLTQSELGRVWVARDGTLVFESRHKRPNASLVFSMTDDDIDDTDTGRGRTDIVNHSVVQAHPRRVDTASAVLFTLANKPAIAPYVSQDVNVVYRDPDARATRVGGSSMIQPVANTDYTFNASVDGLGGDLTAQLTVSGEYSANGGTIHITNNGPYDGFLTKLQCRGIGLYSYETVYAFGDSEESKLKYGGTELALDMPYQSDLIVAKDAADYIVQQQKTIYTQLRGVKFIANREDRLMRAALQLDVSSKISVTETMIGSEPFIPPGETLEVTPINFFINEVSLSIDGNGIVRCSWALEQADPFNYWIIERDGYTELGVTTRLAYGSFLAGWVLGVSQLGVDSRVNP